jgi:hypothetical protein
MRPFRCCLLFFVRLAVFLASTPVAAFEPQFEPRLVVQLPLGASDALYPEQTHKECHLNGADVERIDRGTTDPCLAANSVPGAVCFARLGQSPTSGDNFDAPRDWYRHCEN